MSEGNNNEYDNADPMLDDVNDVNEGYGLIIPNIPVPPAENLLTQLFNGVGGNPDRLEIVAEGDFTPVLTVPGPFTDDYVNGLSAALHAVTGPTQEYWGNYRWDSFNPDNVQEYYEDSMYYYGASDNLSYTRDEYGQLVPMFTGLTASNMRLPEIQAHLASFTGRVIMYSLIKYDDLYLDAAGQVIDVEGPQLQVAASTAELAQLQEKYIELGPQPNVHDYVDDQAEYAESMRVWLEADRELRAQIEAADVAQHSAMKELVQARKLVGKATTSVPTYAAYFYEDNQFLSAFVSLARALGHDPLALMLPVNGAYAFTSDQRVGLKVV